METASYEQGKEDMLAFVTKTINNAIDNPALDVIPSKMALQILLGTLGQNDLRTS